MADDQSRKDEGTVRATLLGYLWEDHRYQRVEAKIHVQVRDIIFNPLSAIAL